jgi:hypothetical protein
MPNWRKYSSATPKSLLLSPSSVANDLLSGSMPESGWERRLLQLAIGKLWREWLTAESEDGRD